MCVRQSEHTQTLSIPLHQIFLPFTVVFYKFVYCFSKKPACLSVSLINKLLSKHDGGNEGKHRTDREREREKQTGQFRTEKETTRERYELERMQTNGLHCGHRKGRESTSVTVSQHAGETCEVYTSLDMPEDEHCLFLALSQLGWHCVHDQIRQTPH